MNHCLKAFPAVCALLVCAVSSSGEVITGTITDWYDVAGSGHPNGPFNPKEFGDGVNHVTGFWSFATWDESDAVPDSGFFYGSAFNGDTEAAIAVGVTDINQITDASIYDFTDEFRPTTDPVFDSELPGGIGGFVVLRNINTGHYGALRVDDIRDPFDNFGRLALYMDATWWFQTDGSANLSTIPAPASLVMFVAGGMTIRKRRRRTVPRLV